MDYNGFTKKDWIIYGVIAAVLIFISVFFGGCGSTRITTIPGDIRQSNAYIIGELAQSVNEFDRGLGEATEKSRNITDAVNRVDYLFQQYEQAALRLRNEVNTLRERLQKEEQNNISGNADNNGALNGGNSAAGH